MSKEFQKEIDAIEVPKTPHLLLLEGVLSMGNSLRAIHNRQTWNMEALIFAIHLYDCKLCFEDVLQRWQEALPFEEAADVDFSHWKNEIWSSVMNVRSKFVDSQDEEFHSIEELSDSDFSRFIEMSKEHLNGAIPINDLLAYLKERNASLESLIRSVGEQLSTTLSNIDNVLTHAKGILYEDIYHRIANEYKASKWEDVRREYDHWKAGISSRQFLDKLNKRIDKHITECGDSKNSNHWANVWEDIFIESTKTIDVEAIGRRLIMDRKELRANVLKIAEYKRSHYDDLNLKTTDSLMRMVLLLELFKSEQNQLITSTELGGTRRSSPEDQAFEDFRALYFRLIDSIYNRWNGREINLGGSHGMAIISFDKEKIIQLMKDIINEDKEVVCNFCYHDTQSFCDRDICGLFSSIYKHSKMPFGKLTAKGLADTIANDISITLRAPTIQGYLSQSNIDDTELGRKLIKKMNNWQ